MLKLWIYLLTIMSFGEVLAGHETSTRALIRNIERTSRKITNAENAVAFNNICIENNLLPKYTSLEK